MSYRNTYLFADIPVEIAHESPYLASLCAKYQTNEEPRYRLTVTKEDTLRENDCFKGSFSHGYLESLAAYRKVCEAILAENVILFHSSAIMVDGKAYLFTAPSGTGKSTHARLWREMLGKQAVMINDDKPLIRIHGNTATVYGTPYDGKEHLSTQTHAPIAGICILHQAKENHISRLLSRDALPTLLSQTYRPHTPALTAKLLPLVVTLANTVPIYSLGCNISREAAELSYHTMTEENK